jgi:hypothetical protein
VRTRFSDGAIGAFIRHYYNVDSSLFDGFYQVDLRGVLKIGVPNLRPSDLRALARDRFPMAVHPLEHINSFNRGSMEKLASRLGLRIVKPTLAQSYAFIRGGIPATPKRIVKEFVRPFWHPSTNLNVWLTR